MGNILIASGFLIYGLLIYHGIYTPAKGGGDGIAIFFIFAGIFTLIMIPFSKKGNISKKDKIVKNTYVDIFLKDKCSIIKKIGVILFFLYLFEYVSDFIFMLSLIAMIFCETTVEFFSKNNRVILFIRIFMMIVFLLVVAQLIITSISKDGNMPILVIVFLLYVIYSIFFKIKYHIFNIIIYFIGLVFSVKFIYKYQIITDFVIDAYTVHYIFIIMSFLILLFITIKDFISK